MNQIATFSAELKKKSGTTRTGRVLFPGDYGPRGRYSVKDLEKIAASFSPCEMNLEHIHQTTPLTGRLGRWVRAFVQGGVLHAEIECPEPLSQLLGDDPVPVSAEIDMKNMKACGLAWTATPFFDQALVAAFSRNNNAAARIAALEQQVQQAQREAIFRYSREAADKIIRNQES